jgi:peptidoglycan-N-acetylglucosamine deacetylase
MKTKKSIASLSLDLDNKWSYLKTHGDSGWESFPSFLDVLIPRVLNFLSAQNLKITVFIVGQDAALKQNHALLRSIAAAGHEIGNHSFRHEPWLHLYSEDELEIEVAEAELQIERATGIMPRGFRAPGYSLTSATCRVLTRRGYLYDASTLPSSLISLARAFYFMTTKLTQEQRQQQKRSGGTLRDTFRPLTPYRWKVERGSLIEIPVTTMPIVRFPIHMSYLICLSVVSRSLAHRYFQLGLKLCRLRGIQPSILLHPTDFLGCEDRCDMPFFPGMNVPWKEKLDFVGRVIRTLCAEFNVVTLRHHVEEVAQASSLPLLEPRFEACSQHRLI